LNVKFPKSIKKVDSIENKSDGIYEYNDDLYYVLDGIQKKISTE
jgi:hypothetical protein